MTTTEKINYNRLAEIAECIVRSEVEKHDSIIAAFSTGSFSRGDMDYGSDVDIAFIATGYPASNKVPPEVTRIISDDILFEWAYSFKENINPKKIIVNHPYPNDLASAKIWYDPENLIANLQTELKKEEEQKDYTKGRATNQLKIVENNFEQYKKNLSGNKTDQLLTNIFMIVMSSFSIPSVILNRPVTHLRSYLFCSNNAKELGFYRFPDLVNKIICEGEITTEKINYWYHVLKKGFDSSGLPEFSIETYKIHLRTVDYALKKKEQKAALWPIYFWMVGAINEVKRDELTDIAKNLDEAFTPIREELKLIDINDFKSRINTIEEVITLSKEMIGGANFKNLSRMKTPILFSGF